MNDTRTIGADDYAVTFAPAAPGMVTVRATVGDVDVPETMISVDVPADALRAAVADVYGAATVHAADIDGLPMCATGAVAVEISRDDADVTCEDCRAAM